MYNYTSCKLFVTITANKAEEGMLMRACGLIVEYNPFHNGHLHHVNQARLQASADCVIAVMSGSFLQRGEPAIIDKFHRTRAALESGVDIVLELPYAFAVQSSQLFAKGAVSTLQEIGVDSLCFGSESGHISQFISTYKTFKEKEADYDAFLKDALNKGDSFPAASEKAYRHLGLVNDSIDLSKPNNILGFSYVKTIMDNHLPIEPLTIKRINSQYHDKKIIGPIASATSIREKMIATNSSFTADIKKSLPQQTLNQLQLYQKETHLWHEWEKYFPLIYYRVLTMNPEELAAIHGVDEGLEHRIRSTIKNAATFHGWVRGIKTKRYTWTRIQRMFVHLLTNTTKEDLNILKDMQSVPYIRLLGASHQGRTYLNTIKKEIEVPLISSLSRNLHPLLAIEERATNAYYSILPPKLRNKLHAQELQPPILL